MKLSSEYESVIKKKENKIVLEAANANYEPIILDLNEVSIQGRLLAVWRKC